MAKISEDFKIGIAKYIPQNSVALICQWLDHKPIRIKIVKPRNSKLGDFKVDPRKQIHEISINGNLNQYSFLVTLVHEIAHLYDFLDRKTLSDPHGDNWKNIYSNMMIKMHATEAFPEHLNRAIIKHINNPKAASCSDAELNEALRAYDQIDTHLLKDLPEGDTFILKNGRQFVKGPLQRTRFRCKEVSTGRWYLVNGQAEVHNLS